jgi:hydroxyacylglutathione hydrolase
MKVVTIPLNDDNYGYLLIDEGTGKAAVIDVSGQPDVVLEAVARENVDAVMVLTTHKHWDHAGGNNKIKLSIPSIEILGSERDAVEGCTRFVTDGEEFTMSTIHVKCLLTPGHTMGHISYVVHHNGEYAVFTGDCLFIGGAGKFFEGTGADMYHSLYEKLLNLPKETKIYCGHEYTLSNYRFALSIDSTNVDLIDAYERAQRLRGEGKPTIPSTIEVEMKTNPFLRVFDPVIQAACGCGSTDPIEVLTGVRESKNRF